MTEHGHYGPGHVFVGQHPAPLPLDTTVAGIPVFNIGAPFWALIAGTLVSLVLERADWRARNA